MLLDVLEEEPSVDTSGLLMFRLVRSSFMKDFEGTWQVWHLLVGYVIRSWIDLHSI